MDPQQTQNQTPHKEKYMGYYIVAFLDLLGQQDALRKVTGLPNPAKPEDIGGFKQKIKEF
jgi:hypothetical protein